MDLKNLLENGIVTQAELKKGILRTKTPLKQLIDFGGYLTSFVNGVLDHKYGLALMYVIVALFLALLTLAYLALISFAPVIQVFIPNMEFVAFYFLIGILFSMYIFQMVEGNERERAYVLFFLLRGRAPIDLTHLQLAIMKIVMKNGVDAGGVKDKLVSRKLKRPRTKYARDRVKENIDKLLHTGLLEEREDKVLYTPPTFHISGIEGEPEEEISAYLTALWNKRIRLINEKTAIIEK